MQKWKSSAELPVHKKLKLRFDIDQLRLACQELERSRAYDGYKVQADLIGEHGPLNGEKEIRGDILGEEYSTLALTEFNEGFSLKSRSERSGSVWDRYVFKKNPRLDERFYGKLLDQLPEYFKHVVQFFPNVHRVRLAKLRAGGNILKHVDYDASYGVRVVIPIFSYEGCVNCFERPDGTVETVQFAADGSSYFINVGYPHWAHNPTPQDRVFLILSIDSQKVLEM